jgi:hypothetical protein
MIALLNMGFVLENGIYINHEYQLHVRVVDGVLYAVTNDGLIKTTIADIEYTLLQEGV